MQDLTPNLRTFSIYGIDAANNLGGFFGLFTRRSGIAIIMGLDKV